MKALCAFGAVAALALGSTAFAADEQHTIEVGSFWNSGVGTLTYNGPYSQFVLGQIDNGHTVITLDVAGLLDSLGYNALWSAKATDNGFNAYGTLSPGADIDLFRMEGASTQPIYSYAGPNTVHQPETSDRLRDRVWNLDSFSGAQDAWNVTHVSLGQNGSLTATWIEPLDLREFVSPGTGGAGPLGGGFGGGWTNWTPPQPGQGGDVPVLFISEHGTFESFHITLVAGTIPAPGALALLGVAGLIGKRGRARRD